MKLLGNLIIFLACCFLTLEAETSFSEFVQDKTSYTGYFSFFHDEDSGEVYLEIRQFEEQFLFQSSLPHGVGSNDIGLDRGQLGDTRLVQFERVGEKVFLRQLNTYYRANTGNPLEKQAVEEAFASSIIWGFKVVSTSEDSVLIDYTPFLLSDIHGIAQSLKQSEQGSYKVDSSRSGVYVKGSRAFPDNTELEATVTYTGSGAGSYLRSVTPESSAVTVNLHHSLIKLPDNNYQTRAFHPYSGFWSMESADYATAIEEPLLQRVIPRHRLEKKNPQAEWSEALEPIVYYLDAGAPEPVRSALIEGAMWWNQAFEGIGYKNAFQVKMMPAEADPMDVRYNVIQWVHRATRGWSYGASVIDPRTGEIIKGHVTLGSLRVRQDYLIALGLTSPFQQEKADTSAMKEMALARIRQLSAHEIGHTLGLAHNFSASVSNRASVMDYPHPYIRLLGSKIDLTEAYAKDIGEWDKYTIAYGYSDFTHQNEAEELQKLVQKTQAKGLEYISDPDARPLSSASATGHLWDNGTNAVDELERVLVVRAKALANFGENSIPYGTPLSEIEEVLVPIYNFHRYQVEAAAKLIGGIHYHYEIRDDKNIDGVSLVSGELQKRALNSLISTLDENLLVLPEHIIRLIPPKAYGYSRNRESFASNTGLTFDPVSVAQASAKHSLSLLLNAERLARLEQQSAMDSKIPSVAHLLELLLRNTIEKPASKGLHLLVQQRVNQEVVDHFLALWHEQSLVTEVRCEVFTRLNKLSDWLQYHIDNHEHKALSSQFEMLRHKIQFSLKNGKQVTPASSIEMPPGSPIGN